MKAALLQKWKRFDFYQSIFAVITWLAIPSSFYFVPTIFRFFDWAEKHNVQPAQWSDAYIIIGAAFSQHILYSLINRSSWSYIYENLDDKYQGEDRVDRATRVTKLVYDLVFYTTSTVFAFYAFGNSGIIPKSFFGVGDCSALFSEYPNKPNIPFLNEYYLYQLGNHGYRLVSHIIKSRHEPKFYEMLLHHYAALCLIMYSYFFNFTQLGSMVLISHDASDIFLCSVRAYDSMRNKNKYIWGFGAIAVLAAWIYARLIFFPACLIKECMHHCGTFPNWEVVGTLFRWKIGLLCVLLVLHVYWVGVLIYISMQSLKRKTVKLSSNMKRQHLMKKVD